MILYGINVVVPGYEAENVGYAENMPAAVRFVRMLEDSIYLTDRKCSFNVLPLTNQDDIGWALGMKLICEVGKNVNDCCNIEGVWHIPMADIINHIKEKKKEL